MSVKTSFFYSPYCSFFLAPRMSVYFEGQGWTAFGSLIWGEDVQIWGENAVIQPCRSFVSDRVYSQQTMDWIHHLHEHASKP